MTGDEVLGVLAGLGSPIVLTVGFVIWEGQWQGSAFVLNAFKCSLASVLFLLVIPFRTDVWKQGLELNDTNHSYVAHEETLDVLHEGGSRSQLFYLVLSSFIGIVIGDNLWLQALKMLGAKRVILVDSIKPFVAAAFGWLMLGESLSALGFAGIILTMGGVLTVSLEKASTSSQDDVNATEPGECDDASCPAASKQDPASEVELQPTRASASLQNDVDAELLHSSSAQRSKEDASPSGGEPLGSLSSSHGSSILRGNDSAQKSGGGSALARCVGACAWPDDWGEWHAAVGYLCAAVNVVVDVYGSVLTKQFTRGLGPWEISLVRFGSAAVVLDMILGLARGWRACRRAELTGQGRRLREEVEEEAGGGGKYEKEGGGGAGKGGTWDTVPKMESRAWLLVALGVVFVTFLAPVLNTHALLELDVAVCLSLTSTGPILSLPIAFLILSQPVSPRAFLGSLVATAGVWLLVWTA